jgi:acyl carrier protein phosphodiesterase
VNFFGHATLAGRADDDPAFVLGAMAPDLLALCGAVPTVETSPPVASGQAHHLRVDALFHANPAFTALQSWASRSLIERGVPRGGARGAAHVAIELLLDGVLAVDGRARDIYARSLVEADRARAPFVWRDDVSERRWTALVARLREGAVPLAYRDLDFVTARLVGALSRRPRLALGDDHVVCLRRFLPALQARVEDEARELMTGLEERDLWPARRPC